MHLAEIVSAIHRFKVQLNFKKNIGTMLSRKYQVLSLQTSLNGKLEEKMLSNMLTLK